MPDTYIIQLSTDYVFSGLNGPYTELDATHPLSYYGRTKLEAENILRGKFTPLSYSEDALEGRFENIKRGNPDKILLSSDFLPFDALERVKEKWSNFKFEDFERQTREPEQLPNLSQVETPVEEKPVAAKPLPTSPDPAPPLPQTADVIPATGLTTTETALLSPSDQIIRQRQRGIV